LRIENGKQEEGNYELSREGIIKDSNKKNPKQTFFYFFFGRIEEWQQLLISKRGNYQEDPSGI